MKVRYTPLQVDVLSVEEQGSPHHAVMKEARTLSGMPVACCGLHSHVPLVAAAVKEADPNLKVAYCMTDFASLPLALSDMVRAARGAGLIDETISCGQAFGGGLEAVNLHSGLLAARHVVRADVAIVAIGPGVVGTATPFGHGGIAQGEAINAVASLGGMPVAVLRISFADERPRHQGVSHHTLTALSDDRAWHRPWSPCRSCPRSMPSVSRTRWTTRGSSIATRGPIPTPQRSSAFDARPRGDDDGTFVRRRSRVLWRSVRCRRCVREDRARRSRDSDRGMRG